MLTTVSMSKAKLLIFAVPRKHRPPKTQKNNLNQPKNSVWASNNRTNIMQNHLLLTNFAHPINLQRDI